MQSKNTNSFEDLLRGKLNEHEFGYHEGQWEKMQAMMQAQDQQSEREKPAIAIYWRQWAKYAGGVAAACLLVAAGWFLHGISQEPQTATQAAAGSKHTTESSIDAPSVQRADASAKSSAHYATTGNSEIAPEENDAAAGGAPENGANAAGYAGATMENNSQGAPMSEKEIKNIAQAASAHDNDPVQALSADMRTMKAVAVNMNSETAGKESHTTNNKYELIRRSRAEKNNGTNSATATDGASDNLMARREAPYLADSSISRIPLIDIKRNTLLPSDAVVALDNGRKPGGKYKKRNFDDKGGHKVKLGFSFGMNTSLNRSVSEEAVAFSSSGNVMIGMFLQYNISRRWAVESGVGITGHGGKYYSWTTDTVQSILPNNEQVTNHVINELVYCDYPLLAKYKLTPSVSVFSGLIFSSLLDYSYVNYTSTLEKSNSGGGMGITSTDEMAFNNMQYQMDDRSVQKISGFDMSIPVGISAVMFKRLEVEGGVRLALLDNTRHSQVNFNQNVGKYNHSAYIGLRYRLIK